MPDTLQIARAISKDSAQALAKDSAKSLAKDSIVVLPRQVEQSTDTPSYYKPSPTRAVQATPHTSVDSVNEAVPLSDSTLVATPVLQLCRFTDLGFYKDNSLEASFSRLDTLYAVRPFHAKPEDVFGLYSAPSSAHVSEVVLIAHPIHTKPLWLDGLALCLFIVMTLLLIHTKKFVLDLFKMLFDYRMSNKHFEEDSSTETKSRQYFAAFVTFILPVFIYGAFSQFFPVWRMSYLHLAVVYLVLSGQWLLQAAVIRITSLVTMTEHLARELQFNRQLAYGATSILLFPIAITMLLYGSYGVVNGLVWSGIAVLASYFLFIAVRTAFIFWEARISIFFWFLYLCVFEISPYLALYVVFQLNE